MNPSQNVTKELPKKRGRKARWLFVTGALFALIVLVPAIVGSFMPGDFHAESSVVLNADAQRVWEAIRDVRVSPISGDMCKETRIDSAEGESLAWREDIGSSAVVYKTLESESGRRLVVEGADEVVPMSARWEFTIEPTEAGCTVHVTTTGTISSGTWHVPFFKFMIHAFNGIESGQSQYLAALKSNVE